MKGIEEFKDKRVGAILSALVIQFGFVFALKTYRDHFQKEKVNLGCALRTLRKYFGSDPAMYKSIALDHIESYNKSMEQHYVPQEVEGDPVTLDI